MFYRITTCSVLLWSWSVSKINGLLFNWLYLCLYAVIYMFIYISYTVFLRILKDQRWDFTLSESFTQIMLLDCLLCFLARAERTIFLLILKDKNALVFPLLIQSVLFFLLWVKGFVKSVGHYKHWLMKASKWFRTSVFCCNLQHHALAIHT